MNYDLDERSFQRSEPKRQLALELFGCDSRLKLSLSVDDIANSLSLREVDALVEECSEGELARFGDARSSLNCNPEYAREDDGTAVTTDFYNVFAGIRARRFEVSEEDLVYDLGASGVDDTPELGAVWGVQMCVRFRTED